MGKKSKQRKLEYAKKRKGNKDSDSDSDAEQEQPKPKKVKNTPDTSNSQFSISKMTIPVFDNLAAFDKCFWVMGMDIAAVPDNETGPSAQLKELRKSMGINVKGNVAGCPPPVTSISNKEMADNSNYSDNGLPISFAKVFSYLNLSRPSPVQMQSWPALLYGSNTLVISPTGSGKTLAYALPAVPHILSQGLLRRKGPVSLVLVPTRELAIQVCSDFKPIQKLFAIKSIALYGGQEKSQQLDQIEGIGGCPAIVVATPGRLLDLVARKELTLEHVTYLVLDEADRMLALGFAEQLDAISNQIRPDRQALMFTATFPGKLRESCVNWLGESCVSIRCGTLDMEQTAPIRGLDNKQVAATQTAVTAEAESTDVDHSTVASNSKPLKVPANEATEEATIPEAESRPITSATAAVGSSLSQLALTINKSISQMVHVCAEHKKPRLLIHYVERVREKEKQDKIRQPGPMLVFCTKIKTVKFVYEFLVKQASIATSNKNHKGGNGGSGKLDTTPNKYRDQPSFGEKLGVGLLHGQMTQQDREKSMQLFKAGKLNILVATDVAARGIHIRNLKYVVNYDFPSSLEQYCHRIGRTGRSGQFGEDNSSNSGFSYSLLTRSMGALSRDLIEFLVACGQQIEPNLQRLADSFIENPEQDDNEAEEEDGDGNDNQDSDQEVGATDDDDDDDENNGEDE